MVIACLVDGGLCVVVGFGIVSGFSWLYHRLFCKPNHCCTKEECEKEVNNGQNKTS